MLSPERRINRCGPGFAAFTDVFDFSNCFPGFTLRREVFAELGGFDQSLFPADDYDLALRVAGSRFKVFYLDEPLCLRREHDGQLSGIANSVKTQLKLAEALKRAAASVGDAALVRRRLAEIEFDTGVSQMKEGSTARGAGRVARALARDPKQLAKAAKIGGRKVRSMVRVQNRER